MRPYNYLALFLLACGSAPTKPSSAPQRVAHRPVDAPTAAQYRQEYEQQCTAYDLDTTLQAGATTYRVRLRHRPDSSRITTVPARYNPDTKSGYETPALVTELLVWKGRDTLCQLRVSKPDFKELLQPDIYAYGNLLRPRVRTDGEGVLLDYSAVIPATRIGQTLLLWVDPQGKVIFTE